MKFAEWEPAYEAVLADFGYPRAGDETARDRLRALLDGPEPPLGPRALSLDGTVAVVAPGRPLTSAALDAVATADAVVAASNAADRLDDAGVAFDLQVTDLDGTPAAATRRTRAGTPVAVHAHGDNVPALDEHVPDCDVGHVLPTTQAAPAGSVCNFGGFTDGDRAAFLADALGADALEFHGWHLDDPDVSGEKRRKLRWAERLLAWLERRRDERFELLDDRREDLTLPWLA